MDGEKSELLVVPRKQGNREGPCGGTFDLLGFTHHWKSRTGGEVIKRRTMRGRLRRALGAVHAWCRRHLHRPVPEQRCGLAQKLQGHYQYFGITGNWRQLGKFYDAVKRIWRSWLDRRSRHARMRWKPFNDLLKRLPLPTPRIVHSIYTVRAKS